MTDRDIAAGSNLRERTAAGTIVNGAFQVGVVTLGVLKGLVVATFLEPSEYAIWGILFVSITSITLLKQVGVVDRFVQQDEEDQEVAWQKAFTLELIFSGLFFAAVAILLPALCVVYGRFELLAPGVVLAALSPWPSSRRRPGCSTAGWSSSSSGSSCQRTRWSPSQPRSGSRSRAWATGAW